MEVDIVHNGGLLYDRNFYGNKMTSSSGISVLENLPEKYDLRDEGKVTGVKFQNPWGACWAFGVLASLESNAIIQGVSAPDYSEKSLVWFSKQERKGQDAPDTELEGVSVPEEEKKEYVYNSGGTDSIVIAALAAWQGASLESAVPYRNAEGTTDTIWITPDKSAEYYTADGDWSVDPSHAYDDAYRFKEAMCYLGFYEPGVILGLENKEEIWQNQLSSVYPALKSWIMEQGAISVNFCANDSSPDDLENGEPSMYYNEENSAQYNPDLTMPNHKVAIVGWDDTYPKENFSIAPPGDGAWIVKNSWSDAWGEDGYFYLSYYDTTIHTYAGYIADIANSAGYHSYDKNYQYDYMGVGSD